MADPYWLSPLEILAHRLQTEAAGLRDSEAAARLARDGYNESVQTGRRHLLVDLGRRLASPLIAILLAAAAAAGLTGDIVSFTLIAMMVILSTALEMIQERRAEATAEALRRSIALRCRVVRDRQEREIFARELVRGDLVRLRAGDLVPADGILVEANALQVNEALLTGEAYPVAKAAGAAAGPSLAEASNALFHGTSIVAGAAAMLVVETGGDTRFGGIATAVAAEQPPSAFERGIRRFGLLIVRLTSFLVLFVLLAHLALGRPPLQAFLFAMALAVGLTPELLPMIMTVALARGAERMAKRRVVVKRLSAIHDLGQMDILCTDKTGTLTEARIALVGHPAIDGEDSEHVLELAAVNASFETGLRSPLDEALLVHAGTMVLDGWTKLDERPFDFEKRRVSVLAQRGEQRLEIVKGAPEAVLALCVAVETASGEHVPLDDERRKTLQVLADGRSRQGLRLLAIAWRLAPGEQTIVDDDRPALTFAGYCVFVDPPKASAIGAVARLARQGIRVKILSGDTAPVVEHLVSTMGLHASGTLSGEEIARLDDIALAARVEANDLFVRVTPDQKTRIVRALVAHGHTVGFLGDGINDAPAIHAADVGLSVDGATDVAREAADMILLAPDLNVLAEGVIEGRRTHANILKYIRMGTSSNFGNMLTMAVASLWLPFLPLTPVQVLLNNFLYDLSQTGIPFDRVDREDEAVPHGWEMRTVIRFALIMGALSSLFDLATFALLRALFHADVPTFRAAWFLESIATQILVVFFIRTVRRPWRSRPHPMLLASTGLTLSIGLTIPFLAPATMVGFAVPSSGALGAIALLVLVYLASAEIMKPVALGKAR